MVLGMYSYNHQCICRSDIFSKLFILLGTSTEKHIGNQCNLERLNNA